jgi:hypothetical protein
VDFPIPATITPMSEQVAVTPAYDPKATILVRKGYYYGTASGDSKFEVENADDISRTYWRLEAVQETNNRNSRAYDKVKEYLVDNYDEIGEEHANEIATILGIDLHKIVDVIFDVTIRASISIPMNKDVDDLSVYDFDIEISSNESDYEIEESEADIDSIREH